MNRETLPPLGPTDIHVWYFDASKVGGDLSVSRTLLTADEKERADRFMTELHSRRFTLRRAILRQLLGAYTQTSPGSLEFEYGPLGKPFVREGSATPRVHFSLSKSGDGALYAFTTLGEVGVDYERIRTLEDWEELSALILTPSEVSELRHLPPGSQLSEFFRHWTLNEAYLKCLGHGLLSGPEHFPLPKSATGIPAGDIPLGGQDYQFIHWTPLRGYIASLVVRATAGLGSSRQGGGQLTERSPGFEAEGGYLWGPHVMRLEEGHSSDPSCGRRRSCPDPLESLA